MGQIKIELDDDLSARLQKAGSAAGQSAQSLATHAIRELLDDIDCLPVAQSRWSEIQSGEKKTIAYSEVMRKLGIAD